MGAEVKADLEAGRIPGAVVLVARRGKIAYFESFGMRDKAAGTPMQKDTIFRIYSMTKPITSVAVLMLLEEGQISLRDPISKYIPELGDLQVGVEGTNSDTGKVTFTTVPAEREITILDLLRHTSGLTYGVSGQSAVKTQYKKAGIHSRDQTLAELIEKLGTLPLLYQPGTRWEYSRSTDVLSRLIEVVSGLSLDRFLNERIFRPLGMTDTGFYVPAEKLDRVAERQPRDGKPRPLHDVTAPPKLLSGGGGLVSTAGDYVRFAQMLLNGGELEGTRILGRNTVECMTADHLGSMAKVRRGYRPGPGYGFGLGVAVRLHQGVAGVSGSPGDYWWIGWAGTYFFVAPQEELIGIVMIQENSQKRRYARIFRSLVIQTIVD
jgi:CubicO group peptidase (beta-lactamase class C family)